jgi:D-amino peptidase
MKIYVMVDMEGGSGILLESQTLPGNANWDPGRKYLTWDMNACVDGCFRGGATEVVVFDVHHRHHNAFLDQLDPRAEYIQGQCRTERMPGVDGFDGVILLGYHAMAGTPEAVLEHTMSPSEWQNFWINGEKSGEIGIDAALAGEHGVPVIMVSGDDKACREARALLKGVVTAQVKKGLNVEGAVLLPKERAHRLIRDSAAKAVQSCRKTKPHRVKPPVRFRLELVSRVRMPNPRSYLKIIDGRTYEVTGSSVEEALYRLEH